MNKILHRIKNGIEYKYCSRNKHWVKISEFYNNKLFWDGLHNYCKFCAGENNRIMRLKRSPERNRAKSLAYTQRLRKKFFDMYGRLCMCCGESIENFLTIEHKNGQRGKKAESGAAAYRTAIKEYRPDLFEVLCYNCNCAKGKYGNVCPHKLHDYTP